jgi:hypothetical protein
VWTREDRKRQKNEAAEVCFYELRYVFKNGGKRCGVESVEEIYNVLYLRNE